MGQHSGVDAVVVGAGHNGLVAANVLADAGWDVLVLEAQDRVGGAVHSDRSLHPDFVTDWFSAFYPLAAASPVLRAFELSRYGLQWTHAPDVLAHVNADDRAVVLSRDLDRTCASVEQFAPGDGAAWRRLAEQFERMREPLVDALLSPFPPVRPALALTRALSAAELLRFARFAVTPVRRLGEELFDGAGGRLLLAGNALHTDLAPESTASAVYGWLLAMLGQTVGFPVPEGGSGRLAAALHDRLTHAGGQVRTGTPVERIEVAGGRAVAVRTAGGERIATRTVLADVSAPALFGSLLPADALPPQLLRDLRRFQWDAATLKLNWALSGPVPWTAPEARGAGTVHLGADVDGLTRYATALALDEIPAAPFLLLGQMTTADGSRSPAGTESVWAYTHLPRRGRNGFSAEEIARQAERVQAVVEARAPGFGELVLARQVQAPDDLEGADANLSGGAVGGGTSGVHQQLFFRPVPGLGRPETPVDGVYLASASAHPGGGVHGAPGSNAARAALSRAGRTGRARRRLLDAAFGRLYR